MRDYPIYEIKKFNCDTSLDEFYSNTFKNHLLTHSFIEKSHSHDFYLIVLFTNGFGKHTIDFETYEIQPGTVFLLQPGQIHSWELSYNIDGFILFFTSEFYNLHFATKRIENYSFFNSSKSNPEIKLNENDSELIGGYFEQLVTEKEIQEIHTKDKIIILLDLLLIELSRKHPFLKIHQSTSYQYKFQQFETVLENYFKSEKSPSFYASKLNITLKHLNRICKEVLDQTVTETIRKRIVLESKRMLTLKQFTISEIAHELGFESNSYFSKIFKMQTGISPKEFINKAI